MTAKIVTTQTRHEVEQMEEQRYQAMLAHDLVKLEKLLSEDLIYTHSSALTDSKASYIESLKLGDVYYQQIEREDVLLRAYGNSAVVTGKILMIVTLKGELKLINNRFAGIWVKQKPGWQLVTWQPTPIPSAKACNCQAIDQSINIESVQNLVLNQGFTLGKSKGLGL